MTKASRAKLPPQASDAGTAATETQSAKRARREVVAARLAEAAQFCTEKGLLLTPLRREVLKLLLERGGSAKAYDLHDDMRNLHGRVAPMTVYRALDFLMQAQLVHRVDSLNVFVACTHGDGDDHHDHSTLMLVCTECGAVVEEQVDGAADKLRKELTERLGFRSQAVEVKGLCQACAHPPAAARPATAPKPEPRRTSKRS
jgi:Fur family zinc uptake transcriptional regulator